MLGWLTAILFFGGIAVAIWTALRYVNQEYVLTNRRVIQVEGVLNRKSTDSSLEKINDAVLNQSVFGRMFDFGDLTVLTASESGIDTMKMIRGPIEFKKAMLDAKHEFEVDMERAGWAPAPPIRDGAAPAGPGAPGAPVVSSASAAPRPDSPTGSVAVGGATAAAGGPASGGSQGRPGRGHPDAGEPGGPARSRRDHGRGVRVQEGGPAVAAVAPPRTGRRRAATITRDPPQPRCPLNLSSEVVAAIIVVAIMLLVGLPIHEFSHALAAYRLGDGTAKMFGRLTLNPVAHFDPVGGSLLALTFIGSAISGGALGFGWAKPTPVNPMNLGAGRQGEALVAAAGPISNFVLAAIGALPLRFILANPTVEVPDIVIQVLFSFVQINLLLMIFNFIPIPPLDGSKVLFAFIDRRTEYQIRPVLEQYGFLILIAILFLPPGNSIGSRIISPILSAFTSLLLGI